MNIVELGMSGGREKPRPSATTLSRFDNDDLLDPSILTSAADIKAELICWLWDGWLAQGKLTVLAGTPGGGKTTLALTMASVVSSGGVWPDGTTAPQGRVVIWTGEDSVADTLVPRLIVAGANLNFVDFVMGQRDARTGQLRPFDPAIDLPSLELAIADKADVRLIVIDSVASVLAPGVDGHQNAAVRRALSPLRELADGQGAAILGIGHFSKNTAGRDPIERINGSVALAAMARTVLVVAKGDDGRRFLSRGKNNVGADGDAWTFQVEVVDLPIGESTAPVTRIQWGGFLEGTAKELLAGVESAPARGTDAASWLTDLLAQGPVKVATIRSEASSAGFGWRTVEAAKAALGAKTARVGGVAGVGFWQWALPSPKTADSGKSAAPQVGGCGLSDPIAPEASAGSEGEVHEPN